MTRKLVLTAVVLAGGLFAVGCGTSPSSGSATPPSGGRTGDLANEAKRKLEEGAKDVKDAASAAGGKVKELQDKIAKELEPVNKKLAELKKEMESSKDASVIAAVGAKLKDGEGKLKAITDMVKESFTAEKLKGLMEGDAMAKLEKVIMDKIAELKKSLGL